MKDETLREYHVLGLPTILRTSTATIETIERLVSQIGNDAVELCGEAPAFFVLPLFARLRSVASEVLYRPKPEMRAVVVMSIANDGIRPSDVIDPSDWWNEAELAAFETSWDTPAEEIDLVLDAWWNEAVSGDTGAPIRTFLRRLYASPPPVSVVRLLGDAPLLPSLLAAQWFLSSTTPRVEYQSLVLKSL